MGAIQLDGLRSLSKTLVINICRVRAPSSGQRTGPLAGSYVLEAGLRDTVPLGVRAPVYLYLGSQPGDYTAVRVVVRWRLYLWGPPPLPGQPLAPGSFPDPPGETDPPVNTGPALMVILSCRPETVWLPWVIDCHSRPLSLRAGVVRLALHFCICSQHLPKIGPESKDLERAAWDTGFGAHRGSSAT